MHLFISSQDIRELTLGLIQEGTFIHLSNHTVSPEEHLSVLDEQLTQWGCDLDQLEGLYVVTGPGSFTASRVSLTILNTIAFTKQIPVFALENPERLSPEVLLTTSQKKGLKSQSFVLPIYDRPPGVTNNQLNHT
ncbi:hypothetical protein CO174_03105 [Candidatus Uhrbacteria bacterium CG_4_9_14_3_um_filter_50_9]|uniref:Gcp-like domain-containing protein n=1 Tax=Candidatus Uhrbacteria bacterium CG_4_9_14_3_um_filter_50_9 TaxID=1975035 RepID=A0A2M7XC49_9BACT|nr:MAG: hypothetical protein CO174_03105 [Candidatus Uhrbacteria bacterium CG_4_9_14_3_um_filter_50_9]